jgi:hypothetical protein
MALQLKSVPAACGPRWVRDALRTFAKRPLAFTGMFAAFLFAAIVVSLLPLVGGLLQMMMLPLLSLGFMVATQSALIDGPVGPGQFIQPLKTDPARRRALLWLCVSYGACALAILLLCQAVSNDALARFQVLASKPGTTPDQFEALVSEPGVRLSVFLGLTLGSLLSVPYWHAPALVHWGAQSAGQALFSSTLALWRSKGAMLLYAAVWGGLMMVAGLGATALLALLGAVQLASTVAMPIGLLFSTVFYISLLFTFNDSFGSAAEARAQAQARAG